MHIEVYPPEEQGTGAFDGGAIVEQKPIGFSGEGSSVNRIGPLFYWAWAKSDKEGYIDSHPHQAFEILTYVLRGRAFHGDSLGTESIVGAGGVQLIQAGSGVYHNERLVGPDCEIFQIWFEPYIRDALQRAPAYSQFGHEDFPAVEKDGVLMKTVIGEGAPVNLVADARMWDVRISASSRYQHQLGENRTLAVLAVQGSGHCRAENGEQVTFQAKDFIVCSTESGGMVTIEPEADQSLSLALIEVPTQVDYPLYPKRR